MTSPAVTGSDSRRTRVPEPSDGTSLIRSEPASGTTTVRSLWRKSPVVIVATRVLEPGLHSPMACGWERA